MKTDNKRLAELLGSFRNAQKRARYWSGTPSFSLTARARATQSGRMAEHYELAMCDQESLAALIKEIGGSVQVKDYRRDFAQQFSRLINGIRKN